MDYALKQGNDKNFMANKPGEVMGSLANAHPFLDGNGRTVMPVHTELANRAGITIAWENTDKADYLQALTKGLDQPGKGHLDNYLKPFVQKIFGKHEQVQTLKSLPGLGPAEAKAVAFTKLSTADTSKATETPKVERPKGQRLR
jgi:cell filamentation protein